MKTSNLFGAILMMAIMLMSPISVETVQAANDDFSCDVSGSLNEDEQKTYSVAGNDYAVKVLEVQGTQARFIINGEATAFMGNGNTYTLADGAGLKVNNIYTSTPSNKVKLIHRQVKNCSTDQALFVGGQYEQVYPMGSGYPGYSSCNSRKQAQCYDDHSFDTYYDDWCETPNIILKRIVRNCNDDSIIMVDGKEEQWMAVGEGKSYKAYTCTNRKQAQCYDDGTFDTYYDESCIDQQTQKTVTFCLSGGKTPEQDLPDLRVTDIAFSPSTPKDSEYVTVSAVVYNAGNEAARYFHVEAYDVIGADKTASYMSTLTEQNMVSKTSMVTGYVSYLGPKQSTTVTLGTHKFSEGWHRIMAFADNTNNVAESNEDNNKRYESFYINPNGDTTGKADLIVSDIEFAKTDIMEYENTQIWVHVKNIGDEIAHSNYIKLYDKSGNTEREIASKFGYTCSPGQTVKVPFGLQSFTQGWHTIRAKVDTSNQVPESNEYNNERSENIYAKPYEGSQYVKLNQQFFLKPQGSAYVTDWSNMYIKLQGIKIKETPETVAGPMKYQATISVSMPIGSSETTCDSNGNCGGGGGSSAREFTMSGGDNIDVHGITLSMIEVTEGRASIVVGKDVEPGVKYVNLGDNFWLLSQSTAIVQNWDNMKVKLTNVNSPYATFEFSQEGKLWRPTTIKAGESANALGATIKVYNVRSDDVYLTVTKQYTPPQDYLDVSISPKYQTVQNGKMAEYTIKVTDKHTADACPVAVCEEGKACGGSCVKPLYGYQISVHGVPFRMSYPDSVILQAGQTKEMTLTVYTNSQDLRPLEQEATMIQVTEVAENEITGNAVTESVSAGGGGGSSSVDHEPEDAPIAESQGQVNIIYTTTPVLLRKAVGDTAYTIQVNVKADGIFDYDKATLMVTSLDPYQLYMVWYDHYGNEIRRDKYSYDGDTCSGYRCLDGNEISPSCYTYQECANSCDAKCVHIPTMQGEPPMPQETVKIGLERGWNLVSIPGQLEGFMPGECTDYRKLLGFVYIKDENRYVTMQEAQKLLGSEFNEYLSENAFWIYAYEDCSLVAKIKYRTSANSVSLTPGWNLVPVTYDMAGKEFGEVAKSCDITSIYSWDGGSQKWDHRSEGSMIGYSDIGYGLMVKTLNSCTLEGNGLYPPEMPE
ncbi:MAG: hypothetical protein KJ709_05655 [Nanoarchaeota archaeon]|nr:hypothetical protein [Nanoarchaeota archaeon]